MSRAGVEFQALGGIAATAGPGLIGGLIVGSQFAKGLAIARGLPYVAVNHLEAHALTARLPGLLEGGAAFPYLLLLISGGHCQCVAVEGVGRYRLLGATVDDAVGEAFDKVGKLLGLGWPGGPALERLALRGDPTRISPFPRPMLRREGCDFSFSGLKTAVARTVGRMPDGPLPPRLAADLAAGFQAAVTEVLADRASHAMAMMGGTASLLVVAGGVAANLAAVGGALPSGRGGGAELPAGGAADPVVHRQRRRCGGVVRVESGCGSGLANTRSTSRGSRASRWRRWRGTTSGSPLGPSTDADHAQVSRHRGRGELSARLSRRKFTPTCVKHALLLALLRALQHKPAPLFVLDTHAGAGRYDLGSEAATRTNEAAGGIRRLRDVPPAALGDYVATVACVRLLSGLAGVDRFGVAAGRPSGVLRSAPGGPRRVAPLVPRRQASLGASAGRLGSIESLAAAGAKARPGPDRPAL